MLTQGLQRMARQKKTHKRYHVNQSPLYKLKSRKKLADLFNMSLRDLERLVNRQDNYRVFTINKGSGKPRIIENPKPHLERIHQRIFHLLRSIEPPSYLHSGIKGRSYITNANSHLNATRLITLDIKSFYPSTLGWHVFEFYRDVLGCSQDVAGLLTQIVTYNNHIPTGSCLSQIMAFYSHYKMFEEIYAIATAKDLIMTCYVDDIAISGNKANKSTLYLVRGILKKRGLESPVEKEHLYECSDQKHITGSVIDKNSLKLPNKKHLQLHHELTVIVSSENTAEKVKMLEVAIGRSVAANQSDPETKTFTEKFRQELRRTLKVISQMKSKDQ